MRDECFIKTLLESFVVVGLLSAAREISKKFKCLVKCNVSSCKSSSRWFKF